MKLPEEYDKRIKLTTSQKEEIIRLRNAGVKVKDLAFIYNVSNSTIYFITHPEKLKAHYKKQGENWQKYYIKEKHTKNVRELNKRKAEINSKLQNSPN